MSQTDEPAPEQESLPGTVVLRKDSGDDLQWADLRPATTWIRTHWVLACALALIAAQLAWKGQFLGHLFFRQDDFHDLDLAVEHRFTWSYLTFIGSGHLIIGLRVIAWVLVRIGGTYNWGLASAVTLVFVAAAGLAALRLLRDLFGERPAILIPLVIYLLTPLTLPDIGIWSSAMESVPLQLATFMALSAHLRYVRTERRGHLLSAGFWMAFGLIFFEKGLVLPVLLFALTVAYLTDRRSLLDGALRSLAKYWKAWALYAALVVAYLAILAIALRTSATQPKVPIAFGNVITFAYELVRDTFLPGAVGGPWQWFPVPGGSFAFGAAPHALVALSAVAAAAVIGASLWFRPSAWRAWAILAGWIILADVVPVAIGRLNAFDVNVLGLETRYLADATPILALCLGLAFWPLREVSAESVRPSHVVRRPASGQVTYRIVAIAMATFVFGSVWSSQAYENVTSGSTYAAYMASATQATRLAPRGTPVFDVGVSSNMVEGFFGAYALQSKVIGDISPGKLRWIRHPSGTIDGLHMFGSDGKLYPAYVYGTTSLPLPAGKKCYPARHGRVLIPFLHLSPAFTGMLRIGYLMYSNSPAVVTVKYGTHARPLTLEPGLHSGYVPISGSVASVMVYGLGGAGLCVGDAQAGNLRPNLLSQPISSLAK
ncbi:MAG TPA: hypothetical protein VF834_24310 [Streptosporangiaceae bacterium]